MRNIWCHFEILFGARKWNFWCRMRNIRVLKEINLTLFLSLARWLGKLHQISFRSYFHAYKWYTVNSIHSHSLVVASLVSQMYLFAGISVCVCLYLSYNIIHGNSSSKKVEFSNHKSYQIGGLTFLICFSSETIKLHFVKYSLRLGIGFGTETKKWDGKRIMWINVSSWTVRLIYLRSVNKWLKIVGWS